MTDEKDLERAFYKGNLIFIISIGLAIVIELFELFVEISW